MKNLGKKSTKMLAKVGVCSTTDLKRLGSVQTFYLVKHSGQSPSLNLLYALEGAIQNRHWLDIKRTEKAKLLIELDH